MPGKKLFLIVEDDFVIRVLSAELLLENGVGILEATDGEEAFELLERRAAEVGALFTDIRMPGKCNGMELAQRVAERWPWISILVTSANYNQRPLGLPQQAQFLSKPWHPEAILEFAQCVMPADLN